MSLVGYLCCLLCRNNCNKSKVSAPFTFFPPDPPGYTVKLNDKGEYEFSSLRKYSESYKDLFHLRLIKVSKKSSIMTLFIRNTKAEYTLLYSHGNASDLGHLLDTLIFISQELCVNVMAYDYAGYGSSNGKPHETVVLQDCDAVYHYLISELQISPKQIIVYGVSIGSGPTCHLASHFDVGGIIIQCGILSGFKVVNLNTCGCFDTFKNYNEVKRIKCPAMVMHGQKDTVVNVSHGRKLFKLIPEKYRVLAWYPVNADHNDIIEKNTDEYLLKMTQFLAYLKNHQNEVECI